ncbi:unnamed protein product [Psylliodes chrysocephalus]|uniref:Tektin n=1 Tax=Psylliodes chrysocephalus TaxID=3402493 RepID=A0A9P0D0D1_9CUCU|nr:unnamed protein product [Psylliodes chrysocephala]
MPPQQHGHEASKFITSINEGIFILPPPPPKYTYEEWYLNNNLRTRTCLDQQRLADSVIAESDRVIEEINERSEHNKKEVDRAIQEKINDINFNVSEIERTRKEVCKEMESLTVYSDRIKNCLQFVEDTCLKVCNKCLIQRERRVGIDFCIDDVERELKKERRVIMGVIQMLTRTLEQAYEQRRRLRSTFYFMDRDLDDKGLTKKIDLYNKSITNTSLNLSIYHGFAPLDPSNITLQEWQKFCMDNIQNASRELTSCRQLRTYVDTLLRQGVHDLLTQYNATNNAFRKRIEELKENKTKMEVQHSEVMRLANEMGQTITRLKKSLSEKEGYTGLAHTRLGTRAQRQGAELCKDLVELSLVKEVADLRANCNFLQQRLAEAHASLRYLLKTQIQLEEDINTETNTLKIDEVDCMTLRQAMDYHPF